MLNTDFNTHLFPLKRLGLVAAAAAAIASVAACDSDQQATQPGTNSAAGSLPGEGVSVTPAYTVLE